MRNIEIERDIERDIHIYTYVKTNLYVMRHREKIKIERERKTDR